MAVNPYESPRPLPESAGAASLQDGRWSLVLTGMFAGGYVGAWVGSLSGAGVGVLFALAAGGNVIGYGDPALTEGLITTGLLIAIVGALTGAGLGTFLGGMLGSLVCISRGNLRKQFIWVSCLATCAAAVGMVVSMFCVDATSRQIGPLAANQAELLARVAALCVVGLGGLFGGGLIGRILREVAWEPRAMVEVVVAEPRRKME